MDANGTVWQDRADWMEASGYLEDHLRAKALGIDLDEDVEGLLFNARVMLIAQDRKDRQEIELRRIARTRCGWTHRVTVK